MRDESSHIEIYLDNDPRLLCAIRSAVHFHAARAGLEEQWCDGFAIASEDVCRQAFTQIADGDGGLNVTVDAFPDRLEISIHHRGKLAPAVGLECFALADIGTEGAGGLNGMELLSRVDRVMFNSEGGVARTTLVKYLQPKR